MTGQLTDIPAEAVRITDLPALPTGTVADGVDVIIRTAASSAGGRKPPSLKDREQNAAVAQLVERLIRNHEVAGSIPASSTNTNESSLR